MADGQAQLVYNAFPIHTPFHLSTAREKLLLGAVGSGKTIAMVADQIAWGLEWPGSRNMVSRKTAAALRDSTQEEFLGILATPPDENDDDEVQATLLDYCEIKKNTGYLDRLWLPNGSEYLFRGLDKLTKRMGLNLSSISVDEANEITYEDYLALRSRLRQQFPIARARREGIRWPKYPRQQIVVAANPYPNWIIDYFIDNPRANTRAFKSTSFDNPTLYNEDGSPSDFLMSLLAAPPIWQARMVWADHTAFVGQILDFDVVKNVHRPFTPPKEWERGMGMDWGLRSPCSIGWWAREPGTGRWFKYREFATYDSFNPVEREMHVPWTVDMIANKIHELEQGETIKWRATGPDTFRRQPSQEDKATQTIGNWFAKRGLHFQVGAAGYDARINALNSVLAPRVASIGEDLTQTYKQYQLYRWEDLKIDSGRDAPEKPFKKDDHLVDADQYLFTLFTGKAKNPYTPDKTPSYEESVRKAIRQQTKKQHARSRGKSVWFKGSH